MALLCKLECNNVTSVKIRKLFAVAEEAARCDRNHMTFLIHEHCYLGRIIDLFELMLRCNQEFPISIANCGGGADQLNAERLIVGMDHQGHRVAVKSSFDQSHRDEQAVYADTVADKLAKECECPFVDHLQSTS